MCHVDYSADSNIGSHCRDVDVARTGCSTVSGGVGVGESATTQSTASAIVPAAGTPTADSPVATPTSGQGAACEVALEHMSDLVILDDGAEATLSGAYVGQACSWPIAWRAEGHQTRVDAR